MVAEDVRGDGTGGTVDRDGAVHARALAARRRRIARTCEVCGAPITGIVSRRYCSNRCASRAYRARHRTEYNARARQRRRQRAIGVDADPPPAGAAPTPPAGTDQGAPPRRHGPPRPAEGPPAP